MIYQTTLLTSYLSICMINVLLKGGITRMAKITASKKKLSVYVIEEIKRMLIAGELQEGSKLPNQNEFAKQLGVSRLTLREAMQRLSQIGVIVEKPGVGTHIIKGDPSLWDMQVEAPLLADAQATIELLEARRALEITIVKASVKRVTQSEISMLKKDIVNMEKALKKNDMKAYLKSDMAFHFHLANASHNRYLLRMLKDIQNLLEQFMLEAFSELPQLLPDSMHYHEQIFEHLVNHELEEAVKSMSDHISSIEGLLKEYYTARNVSF